MRELYKKGQLEDDIMSANWDQFKLEMANAQIGMHYSESWLPGQFVELGAKEEDIGMFPFPGAKNIKVGAGKMWGISKDTEYPELAKAFLDYMLKHPFFDTDVPSNVSIEVKNPYVEELLSYGVEPVFAPVADARFGRIRNELGLNNQNFLMTYVMEPDDEKAQSMVEEWNEKWAEARLKYAD